MFLYRAYHTISLPHCKKLVLFYNLNFTEVYIYSEKYVIHYLNFVSNMFIWIYSGGGGREAHAIFKAINIWEPLL
jgi:hypothetical protein